MTFELGVCSFDNTPRLADGRPGPTAQAVRDVLEAINLADEVGLDYFGIGEHHMRAMPLSSPTAVVNAAAASTQRIKLSTAVSVLSTDDPIRVFQQLAAAASIAPGRIETVAGRGSSTITFPLFDHDEHDYDLWPGTFARTATSGCPMRRWTHCARRIPGTRNSGWFTQRPSPPRNRTRRRESCRSSGTSCVTPTPESASPWSSPRVTFPTPVWVELVRELRDRDPVEHVRRNAAILLDGLSERELTCTASSPEQLRPDSYRTVRPNCRRALIRCPGGSPVA
jgi:hypothetical protein